MDYKQQLLEIIYEILPNCKVYLFGSRARQEHESGADIDLALDIGEPIAKKQLSFIQDKIEESTIPLSVDLIDLHNTTDALKKEIVSEGVLWEN
jgi:predicted nucleotidyltransferase